MDFDDQRQLRATLRNILDPTMDRLGYRLSAIEFTSDTKGPVVRLYIDQPAGVDISDCILVSREISPLLDVEDPIHSAYRLEVSSPGTDRILELDEDFSRFAGFNVRVRMTPGTGRKQYKGLLSGLQEDDLVIESGNKEHRIPVVDIAHVRLNPSPEQFDRLRALTVESKGESP